MSLLCFVVDDHLKAANLLVGYIERAGLRLAGLETDPAAALIMIEQMMVKPDVVFLDISMPGINGLEMAERLNGCSLVIFTTGHRDYGAEAYKVNAAYYLVKPITYSDFLEGINKARLVIAVKEQFLQSGKDFIRIPGNGKGSFIRLKLAEIVYLKSAEHYVSICCEAKEYLVHRSMKDLLAELGGLPFIRVHKSYAVNLHKVLGLKDGMIILSNGAKVDLGSNYRDDFLRLT